MIKEVFYFMPCMVCFIWLLILLLKKRNRPQNYLLPVLAFGTVYYACYAITIFPDTDYSQMANFIALNEFLVPAWMAFQLLYLESHLRATVLNNFMCFCLFILPCVHSGIMAVVYYVVDFEDITAFLQVIDGMTAKGLDFFSNPPAGFEDGIYKLYFYTAEKQFHFVCLVHSLCTVVMGCIVMYRQGYRPFNIVRFISGKGATTSGVITSVCVMLVLLLQCPLMTLGRSYIITSPYLGLAIMVLEAIVIFLMCFVEYMSHDTYITMESLKSGRRSHKLNVGDLERRGYDIPLSRSIEINYDEVREMSILNDKITSLIDRIQHAFEVEKIYQNPDVTLQNLAEKLNTNRTTLSMALKFKYKMTFKEYLSHCRIERAKEYMLRHPDEVIESVADRFGFGGSSNFAHKFKDEVGESPKAWLQARLAERRSSNEDKPCEIN